MDIPSSGTPLDSQLSLINQAFLKNEESKRLGVNKGSDGLRVFQKIGNVKEQRLESGGIIYFRIATFISDNKHKLVKENLGQLQQLENLVNKKINQIHKDTTGFKGFFRYLFNPDEKAEKLQQKQNLEILKEFVKDVIHDKKTEKTEGKEEKLTAEMQEPIQHNLLSSKKTSIAPSHQPIISSLENPSTSITENPSIPLPPSNVPIPPKPPGSFKPPPPKLFEGEPIPLAIIAHKYKDLPKQQLQDEMQAMQVYRTGVEKALAPIKRTLEEVENIDKQLIEKNSALTTYKARDATFSKNIEQLKNSEKNEVCWLQVVTKKGKNGEENVKLFPFFSEDSRKEINDKRQSEWEKIKKEKIDNKRQENIQKNRAFTEKELEESAERLRPTHLQLIPEMLSKEKALAGYTLLKAQIEPELNKLEKEIKELNQRQAFLKKTENNGIPFDNFKNLIDSKEKQLIILNNGIKNREMEIKKEVVSASTPITPSIQETKVENQSDLEKVFNALDFQVMGEIKALEGNFKKATNEELTNYANEQLLNFYSKQQSDIS